MLNAEQRFLTPEKVEDTKKDDKKKDKIDDPFDDLMGGNSSDGSGGMIDFDDFDLDNPVPEPPKKDKKKPELEEKIRELTSN